MENLVLSGGGVNGIMELGSLKALEKLMKEENIKIIKDAEVTEIISNDNKVSGVKLNNLKIIECDYIVCNSDPPNVY